MARVTKINVGGTNYDIAHEGELKNSGFEVVSALPTTGLFAGREVMYNGKKYVYSSGWEEEITKNTMYEANLRWGGRNIANGFSPTDAGMVSELSANVMAFPNPAGISIEYSRDGGVTWLDYGATDEQKVNIFTTSNIFVCGKGGTADLPLQLRITITPYECGLYTNLNKIIIGIYDSNINNCRCTLKGLIGSNVNDGNEDDSFYETIIDNARIRGNPGFNVLNFEKIYTRPSSSSFPSYFHRLRLVFSYTVVEGSKLSPLSVHSLRFFGIRRFKVPSNLAQNNHLYTYDWQQNAFFPKKVQSKEIINFDVNNIEPTQTGNVSKTSTWLWQYLTQAVNWLKANNVRLSAYNTKVAALEQADSDNNASTQSVRTDLTELSNSLAAVARSGSYNDLTDKPAFSGSYNDLTDKPTLFSGSYNDLTDKPNLAAVATSGSYNDLSDKPFIPNSFTDLSGKISSVQISEGAVGPTQLLNSSMTLNGINCELGDTKILPCIISFDSTLYKVRIYQNWLQIYRNGIWANTFYLLSNPPTECRYITDLSDPSWYDESVTEYELDNSATEQLLRANSSTNIANWIEEIGANQITFNSSVIASKNKGALDNIISNLKGKGYSVFVENDIDTILSSGNDWVISIKIKRFNDTYKAIIECYVAR